MYLLPLRYICMCAVHYQGQIKSIQYVYRILFSWHFLNEYATRLSSCWFSSFPMLYTLYIYICILQPLDAITNAIHEFQTTEKQQFTISWMQKNKYNNKFGGQFYHLQINISPDEIYFAKYRDLGYLTFEFQCSANL